MHILFWIKFLGYRPHYQSAIGVAVCEVSAEFSYQDDLG